MPEPTYRPSGRGLLRLLSILGLGIAGLALSACSTVSRTVSTKAIDVVEASVAPAGLQLADVDMACSYALTSVPLLDASRAFGASPALVNAVLLMTAGVCADARAADEELRYLRAFRSKRLEEAEDARAAQKHWARVAMERQLASFGLMRAAFEGQRGYTYGRGCPRFRRDFDELAYLVGSIAGTQAVLNAATSQRGSGGILDIPPQVEAAMACLDNAKWWGGPEALRAVVLSILPGGAQRPELAAMLERSMARGERDGVRVAHVMAAIAASAADDDQRLRAVIKRFALTSGVVPNPRYRLVDAMAEGYVQSSSDRLWTRATGSRTPAGGLGRFWDDKADSGVDVDAMLK
jgi:hypothetical protein